MRPCAAGVSVGATSGNRSGRFGAVSWISVFPFLSDAPVALYAAAVILFVIGWSKFLVPGYGICGFDYAFRVAALMGPLSDRPIPGGRWRWELRPSSP